MIFKKKGSRNAEVDMSDLEKKLKKSKKEVRLCHLSCLFNLCTKLPVMDTHFKQHQSLARNWVGRHENLNVYEIFQLQSDSISK